MHLTTDTPVESPKKELVYRVPVHQLADGYRRGLNRTKLDKDRRHQVRLLRQRRTALAVLADVNRGIVTEPETIARAHQILDAPRQRVLMARKERKIQKAIDKALAKLKRDHKSANAVKL